MNVDTATDLLLAVQKISASRYHWHGVCAALSVSRRIDPKVAAVVYCIHANKPISRIVAGHSVVKGTVLFEPLALQSSWLCSHHGFAVIMACMHAC